MADQSLAKTTAVRNTIVQLEADSKPSRLLSLPGELRNLIYRFALVTNEPIYVRTSNDTMGDHSIPIDHYQSSGTVWFADSTDSHNRDIPENLAEALPQLLMVNKQIREEAHAIYFRENTFQFPRNSLYYGVVVSFARMAGASAKFFTEVSVANDSKDRSGVQFTVRVGEDGRVRIQFRQDNNEPNVGALAWGSCCCCADGSDFWPPKRPKALSTGEELVSDFLATYDHPTGSKALDHLRDYGYYLQKYRRLASCSDCGKLI